MFMLMFRGRCYTKQIFKDANQSQTSENILLKYWEFVTRKHNRWKTYKMEISLIWIIEKPLRVGKVHRLITNNLELHRLIIKAMATKNLDGFYKGWPRRLVLME